MHKVKYIYQIMKQSNYFLPKKAVEVVDGNFKSNKRPAGASAQ
jgi:hypothetical protein